MSAIWGAISFEEEKDFATIEKKMKRKYEHCVIDRFESYVGKRVAMGCGIQYFVPEAKNEILPIIDEENGIFFTADAIVDNREELMEKLGITDPDTPDARILFEMFHKYKEKCLNDIRGDYSFVYFDQKENICYLVTDATGRRILHYYWDHSCLYFSTLIFPLLEATGPRNVNERWVADYLGNDNFGYITEHEETVFSDILRVPAFSCYSVTKDKIQKNAYWNIEYKVDPHKKESDYKREFLEIYRDAVRCRMRNDSTTMLLSGGLDSSSVACFAAEYAKETGKTLTSYTSIPEYDVTDITNERYNTNEYEAVLKTQKFLQEKGMDLKCDTISLLGKNSWEERIDEMIVYEYPYKSMQNLLWIKEGLQKSYQQGARILLEGSYGNVTISSNQTNTYLYDLAGEKKYCKLLRECYGLNKEANHDHVLKRTVKSAKRIMDRLSMEEKINENVLKDSMISQSLVEKYNVVERLGQRDFGIRLATKKSELNRAFMKNEVVFCQIGESATRHSLATGVIQRDPTADKRIIEFCYCLPTIAYIHDGVQRRVVKNYMNEILPPHVLNNKLLGLQSADNIIRLQKKWDVIQKEIMEILDLDQEERFVDHKKVMRENENLKELVSNDQNFAVARYEYTALMIEFLFKMKETGQMKF